MVQGDEIRQFRTDARNFVRLMKRIFPSVSVFPKLHILLHYAPAFMDRSGSVGLYGQQAVESWPGFFKQNAAKYTAQTEVGSCANVVRAMAVAREASDSNRKVYLMHSNLSQKRCGSVGNCPPGAKVSQMTDMGVPAVLRKKGL